MPHFSFRAAMSLIPSLVLAVAAAAPAIAQTRPGLPAPPTSRPTSRPAIPASAPLRLTTPTVGHIERAHGADAWRRHAAVRARIRVSFGGQPTLSGRMVYDHHGGRVRMELEDGTLLVFDGERAWVHPETAEIERARFHLLTWPYFLAAPFKLRDPGTHVRDEFPRSLDRRSHRTLRLTFDAGVGDAPDDWYLLYVDLETNRLAAMAYIVTYGADPEKAARKPHAIVYHDEIEVGGTRLSSRWTFHDWSLERGPYGDPIGEATITEVTYVEPTDAMFTKPDGAREDVVPKAGER